MNCRKNFISDLLSGKVSKGSLSYSDLAESYNYPKGNGANLCKKDYYKYLRQRKTSVSEKLLLRSQWEAQTKGGGTTTLKSYRNNITPIDIEEFRADLIEQLENYKAPDTKLTPNLKVSGNLLVLSLPDYHLGREPLNNGVSSRYLQALVDVVEKSSYNVDRILYVIGNDFFNTDNVLYQTTKGTQQFDFNTWKQSWLFGKKLLLDSIEILRTYNKPLDIIMVSGNHDEMKMFMMGDLIKTYYKDCKGITVNNGDEEYKVHTWGNTLMMFNHGELRDTEYPLILATERPKEWGMSEYRYVFLGHLHHSIEREFRGNVYVHTLPSLSPNSEWEKKKGYKAQPKAKGFIINKANGLISQTINNY